MWRRHSLTLSSKLARLNSNPSPFLLLRSSPKSHRHGPLARSNSTSPESTSAADPVTWSQSRPDVRYLGTGAACGSAVDLPAAAAASASAVKGKEVAELVKHYGRCYWELSKARLRLLIFVYFNSRMFSFHWPPCLCDYFIRTNYAVLCLAVVICFVFMELKVYNMSIVYGWFRRTLSSFYMIHGQWLLYWHG